MSLVVDAHDDDPLLDECLDSLRSQTYGAIEILVVALGGSHRALATARRHAGQDWRMVVRQHGSSRRGEARSFGAGFARGKYLGFLRAGDRLPQTAVKTLVDSLERSGSDFALGMASGEQSLALGSPASGLPSGKSLSVEEAPQEFSDAILGSPLFRRTYWQRLQPAPDEPAALVVANAALRANAFDVVADVTYHRAHHGSAQSFGRARVVIDELPAWADSLRRVRERLLAKTTADVASAWAAHVLDTEVGPFLDDAERADDSQWRELQQTVQMLTELAGEAVRTGVCAEARVKTWLTQHARRAELEEFVVHRLVGPRSPATEIRDGLIYARLPFYRDNSVAVPDECFVLLERETPLVASSHRPRWFAESLEFELMAYVHLLDLSEREPEVTVRLVHDGSGTRSELPVFVAWDPAISRPSGQPYQNYDRGLRSVCVRGQALVELSGPDPSRSHLEVTLAVEGVERTTSVEGPDPLIDARQGADETPLIEVVDLGESLLVRGRWPGDVPEEWTLRLRHRRLTITGMVRSGTEGRFQVMFSLRWDEWGIRESAVPTGAYDLELVVGEGEGEVRQEVSADAALEARCPQESLTGEFRMRVRVTPRRRIVVHLGAALADDEIGAFNQRRLQESYARTDHVVNNDAVYFQAYTGEGATDSPLAIHQALRQVRPDLVLYWCVADSSAWVPEGAVPVLMRSRRWYDVLASSRYVVNNIVFDRWFVPRPHQRVLQTFHGYPSKTMGVALWKSQGFTPSRIQLEIERTAHTWDVILTPAPEMDKHYRREFRFEGQILSMGYPRDDVLVSSDAPLIRAATRSRLGIREGQTVVLYAPTWRDDAATDHRSARMVPHLDIETASRELGDEFVLLVRGHRFHGRGAERTRRTARVIDVTEYPEINDLVLAADAAVMDYSSLRFDFALTGKPMLFLVPDLEHYEEAMRGFLFDYRETAPGPLMSTTADAVSCLHDLAGVADKHAEEYARFNATYNYLQDGAATERVVEAFFG